MNLLLIETFYRHLFSENFTMNILRSSRRRRGCALGGVVKFTLVGILASNLVVCERTSQVVDHYGSIWRARQHSLDRQKEWDMFFVPGVYEVFFKAGEEMCYFMADPKKYPR